MQILESFWQGMAKLFILHQAGEGPVYGFKLKKCLENRGYAISSGTLYPLLHDMEKANILESRLKVYKGRVRKYYIMTPKGRACLEGLRQTFADLCREIILEKRPHNR